MKPILSTCVICYNENVPHEHLGTCSHLHHRSCVEQQLQPICSLCREPLKIRVRGNVNEVRNDEEIKYTSIINYNYNFWRAVRSSISTPVIGPVIERWTEPENTIENWKELGYTHRSEHPDYDSENPDSELDYPDEEEDENDENDEY